VVPRIWEREWGRVDYLISCREQGDGDGKKLLFRLALTEDKGRVRRLLPSRNKWWKSLPGRSNDKLLSARWEERHTGH